MRDLPTISGPATTDRKHAPAVALLAGLLLLGLLAGCGDDGGGPGPETGPPNVERIVAVPAVVEKNGEVQLTALASDPDDDPLTYTWSGAAGTFSQAVRARILWTAPADAGLYPVKVVVSARDGADSATFSIQVGSGALRVESDPPGAGIYLNARLTAATTPHLFENLAVGEYNIQLASPYLQYQPVDFGVTIVDGETAHAAFLLPEAGLEVVDTGPAVMDEIGGVAYTAGGIGVVYTARSGSDVTVRSASLVPTHAGTNGTVLVADVLLEEPLAVRPVPFSTAELAFVTLEEIHIGQLFDLNVDGLIERLDDVKRIIGTSGSTYAPAFSQDGRRIAFSFMPSTAPNSADVLVEADYDSARVTRLRSVSLKNGNSPGYGIGSEVYFESGGELYEAMVDTLNPAPARKVTNTGGFARAPAVSPNGRYVAFLDTRGALRLYIPDLGIVTTLRSDIQAGRVAWSPDGRELVLADNRGPGQARLVLLINLPIF